MRDDAAIAPCYRPFEENMQVVLSAKRENVWGRNPNLRSKIVVLYRALDEMKCLS